MNEIREVHLDARAISPVLNPFSIGGFDATTDDANQIPETSTEATGDVAICEDEENAWATYNGNQPITARQLAGLLEVYGIKSQLMRLNRYNNPARGFKLAQFSEAFAR